MDLYSENNQKCGKEFFLYLVFLTTTCIIAYSMVNMNIFYLNSSMEELFVRTSLDTNENGDFTNTKSIDDFWKFTEHVLIKNLYWQTWYQGKSIVSNQNIYYTSHLLGSPRIRQLRVKDNSCRIHEEFKIKFKQCFAAFAGTTEDQKPFGLENETAWTFHSSNAWHAKYEGYVGSYHSGGYYADLGLTRNEAKRKIFELKENLWIDRATRVVFLDFAVYNPNVNLFCLLKFVWEFPASGGVLTTWKIRSLKLIRYVSTADHILMGVEWIFCAFTLYHVVIFISEIKKGFSYFKNVWNTIDLTILIISLCGISFSIYRSINVRKNLSKLLSSPSKHPDFEGLSFWENLFSDSVAVAVFVCWIKFFKFISVNKTMRQLTTTMYRCWKEVSSFGIMLSIVFFAYSQLGYLLFGHSLKDYCTVYNSLFTLFRIILGEFDFYQLQRADRILGPFYFIAFVFFVFFVLLNMFLAILNDTYSNVKRELEDTDQYEDLSTVIKTNVINMCRKLACWKKTEEEGNMPEDLLDHEQVCVAFKSCGLTEAEILYLYDKYKIQGKYFELNEVESMRDDLLEERLKQTDKKGNSE